MTDEFEKRAEEIVRSKGGMCLVPKPDSQYGMTSHERTFCDCQVQAMLAEALREAVTRGDKKWMQENERYHAMRWELHQEMEKLRAAGPRVVTEEELERMADEFDPPEGWREDDRDGTSFKIGFRKCMELNARAEIERLWPSDEAMDEALMKEMLSYKTSGPLGYNDGAQDAIRILKSRLLGEGKCERPATDAADRAELSGEFGVEPPNNPTEPT